MKLNLFGTATRSQSWAITAQKRVNCFVERRQEAEKTITAHIGLPAPQYSTSLDSGTMRGMWGVDKVNRIFYVNNSSLSVIDLTSGLSTSIGSLSTIVGPVSFTDDGTYLVLVDGTFGYYYNMISGGALTKITSGNFTTTPTTVTWLDTYFIVTSAAHTRQFQLSANSDPSTWPSTSINFAGSGGGALRAGIVDHSILMLFGDNYTEFWQDAGAPVFPFAKIQGSSQQFGVTSGFSLAKFDNTVAGLFRDHTGNIVIARINGFGLQKISDGDIDTLLQGYIQSGHDLTDAIGYSFAMSGHAFYVLTLPQIPVTFIYDARSNAWSNLESLSSTYFSQGIYSATVNGITFLGPDGNNGYLSQFTAGVYYTRPLSVAGLDGKWWPFSITSKHIWADNKYIGIDWIEFIIESGVGFNPAVTTVSGGNSRGDDPQMMLEVSKDGGNSFSFVGFTSMGMVGEYTKRVIYTSLGAARDWVLRVSITDPNRRVILDAVANVSVSSF